MSLSFLRRFHEEKEGPQGEGAGSSERGLEASRLSILNVLIKRSVDKEIAQETGGTMVFKWHN